MRASKPFADPDQLAVVLAEVAGPDGPFQGFALTEDRKLARTTYELTGTVDLGAGLEAFTDAELAELLGGEPLGASVEEIEAELGEPLSDVFTMDVTVSMPDGTESSWQPAFDDAEPDGGGGVGHGVAPADAAVRRCGGAGRGAAAPRRRHLAAAPPAPPA